MNASSQLGDRVRSLRQKRSLTQTQLAKASGVSQSLISQVEKGARIFPASAIANVCKTLAISPNDLLNYGPDAAHPIKTLADAWHEYDVAVSKNEQLMSMVEEMARFLHRHMSSLLSAVSSQGDVQHRELSQLQTWTGEAFRQNLKQSYAMPRRSENTQYLTLSASVLSPEALSLLLPVVSMLATLPPEDLAFVSELTARLASSVACGKHPGGV